MRGYVVLAQNTNSTNYVECAEALALTLKHTNPDANITLISDDVSTSKYFDKVVNLPYGDLAINSDWKLINDYQVYEASPYDETIKIEADMFVTSNMDYYFDMFNHMDVCVCDTIRDRKGNISDSLFYRQFITDNKLPNVYNALTYFKKTEQAQTFFSMVREFFNNWDDYKSILVCNTDEVATTDWVYSLACHIMGVDKTTIPNGFSMVHMKQMINFNDLEDWTKEFVYEFDPFRIQTITQTYPVHYHVKSFAKHIKAYYDR